MSNFNKLNTAIIGKKEKKCSEHAVTEKQSTSGSKRCHMTAQMTESLDNR